MGTIYERVWNTIVWLGEESDNSNKAINLLKTVTNALQYYTNKSTPQLEDFERLSLPVQGSPQQFAPGELLSRPWFQ